ncbi:MAG: hypothetical protein K2G31_05330 [Clostridia bacterium]|nr:hypothetical protein [Clostridia bacterium]
MNTAVTKHSLEKAKERLGINKNKAETMIANALCRGKTAEHFVAWERSFLVQESKNGCRAIAYNGFCYIVSPLNTCITLYPLPSWFGHRKHFDGKEKIRNVKRYNKLHYTVEERSVL